MADAANLDIARYIISDARIALNTAIGPMVEK